MKILIFYQYFGTPNGGWSTRYYEFTRRWVKEGHQISVVTSPYYKSDIKADGFISHQSIEGVELIVIDSPDSNKDTFFKRAWNALRFSATATYFALTHPHDVVISSSGPITTAIPGLLSHWIRKKPLVFEVRDLWPKGGIELGKLRNPFLQKIALKFEQIVYSSSSLVIACSEGMKSGIREVSPTSEVLVITNSSDTELFGKESIIPKLPERFDTNTPIFLYAGSLGLMDDCRQIVHGLNVAKNITFQMVFIGDGAEKEYLIQLTKSLGLENKVWFLGLIPKTEVVKWFSLASASFVTFKDLPVLHTSSPNKMFDSFAAGVPIIQSTRGWIADLVQEHECGINVDPSKPEEIAKAIHFFIHNPEKAKLMGENARKLAENEFNRTILATKFLNGILETVA
ncbi:glycosyltransferase involved in cell wall biosynthesis [Algoriphagus aquaeductus]|uniref:Glycosyltransferase involved in cell wall biosynthesis n=1 Tax=Algoriphagus aquaeductus TaxID=475299 RepID=A0A326RX01_9BACT|nr:glycosyltransferase family 4 protein [Algoriphagus aquaeductus]PZV79132.1 glycosyltransferase involved in cell wall biosynthesis [Algoriphagus aquaeductus]